MLDAQATANDEDRLDSDTIFETLRAGLEGKFTDEKVLVLIPDHTRSIPLPMLFRMVIDVLEDAQKLDFMVALGTHPPLSEESLMELVGLTYEERNGTYRYIDIFNHEWNNPDRLMKIGKIKKKHFKEMMGDLWHPSLEEVDIEINKSIAEYDHIIVLGPVFPHEVAGFSGGGKYLMPGISGAAVIHSTHWMGALVGVTDTIGVKDTPVRTAINHVLSKIETPLTLIAVVVEKHDDLSGIFIGDMDSAWQAAVDLSSKRHIVRVDKPFKKILAQAPTMYDELWTAAKAVYKLESVVEDGGEIILYAPHLYEISVVHEDYIREIGYHTRDYFLKQWDKFKHIPLGIIAHSIHVRGAGTFDNGIENPRIQVTLATSLSREITESLDLTYRNPEDLNPDDWENREQEGILYIPRAGEILHKLR